MASEIGGQVCVGWRGRCNRLFRHDLELLPHAPLDHLIVTVEPERQAFAVQDLLR